jgi:hypothetical protein
MRFKRAADSQSSNIDPSVLLGCSPSATMARWDAKALRGAATSRTLSMRRICSGEARLSDGSFLKRFFDAAQSGVFVITTLQAHIVCISELFPGEASGRLGVSVTPLLFELKIAPFEHHLRDCSGCDACIYAF